MNDYNNQIGKNMKLNALVSITYLIEQHKAKLEKLGEKEIENLSISELAFIKMVSSGSITTMKKHGAQNDRILLTEKKETVSKEEKIKRYLKSLSYDELMTLVDSIV